MQKRRWLNKLKPHIVQREPNWFVCNLPSAGRWYCTGDGYTAKEAYDSWYQCNFNRVSGKWHSRHAYTTLRAAGLTNVIHPILNHDKLSGSTSVPNGIFATSHRSEP